MCMCGQQGKINNVLSLSKAKPRGCEISRNPAHTGNEIKQRKKEKKKELHSIWHMAKASRCSCASLYCLYVCGQQFIVLLKLYDI